jgi:SAM-dependent methyltransferase
MAGDAANPNAAQAANWNGPHGKVWVQMQDALDRELADLGRAAEDALSAQPGERILDLGCGCGTTTLALARTVGPGGEALGLDLSRPMLEVARRRATEAGLAQARFVEADAQLFRPDPAGYDGAYSRFGVMLFADPVAAFVNIAASLRPRGRIALVVWRTPGENPAMSLPLTAAAHLLPATPPADPLAPGPFAFADPDRVRHVLAEAGLQKVQIEPCDTQTSAGGLDESVALYTRIGPVGRALREKPHLADVVTAAVREALAPFDTPQGVKLNAAGWIVTASKRA